MVGGQVSYRPLRYSSHGVQMYRIPICNKMRYNEKHNLMQSDLSKSRSIKKSCAIKFFLETGRTLLSTPLNCSLMKEKINVHAFGGLFLFRFIKIFF